MIPVYINNWNILTWVKNMAAYLEKIPNIAIFIIDNNSTYRPLLDWYNTCGYNIIRLPTNKGARWGYFSIPKGQEHKNLFNSDYFVFTDADLDISGCPTDLIEVLINGFEKHKPVKSGLSIEVNDIPKDTLTPDGTIVESDKWSKPLCDMFFEAHTDTTFALYHKDSWQCDYHGIRSNRPYTSRHLPWYFTPQTQFTNEEIFMYTQRPITDRFHGGRWTNVIYKHMFSKKFL